MKFAIMENTVAGLLVCLFHNVVNEERKQLKERAVLFGMGHLGPDLLLCANSVNPRLSLQLLTFPVK